MDYPLTTNAILEYGNRVFPHKRIITYLPNGDRHAYSFGDMYSRTKQLANALSHTLGVTQGDTVGTFAWNHGPHVELYYGISGIGAICHTINIRLSIQQIEYIINHAEDKVIFVDATLVPMLEPIAARLETVNHWVVLNAPEGFTTTLNNVHHYEELLESEPDEIDWPELDEKQACAMCYTSGTTGLPKGVLYSHRSTYLHAMAIMTPNAGNVSNRDVVLLVVRQFHEMAWGYPYLCVMAGADMVLPSSNLQPAALIKVMQAERVSKANGVPTIWLGIYQEMKKNPPTEPLALEEYVVGGSALPKSLIQDFQDDFGIQGVHAWGMTETSPLGTLSRPQQKHDSLTEAERLDIWAKQGIAFPGVELRIVSEEGTPLPWDGQTMGELQIRGAWVIDSYFKTGSKQSFTDDGWFRTGDISTIDEDGYMEIKDRSKDLIKSGGEWISSVALETSLMAHPGVKEAAVIAIPDEKWIERPLATVTRAEGTNSVSTEELQELLSHDFAKYQIPQDFVYLDEIPKTSVGKFDKKELRRLHAEGELRQ